MNEIVKVDAKEFGLEETKALEIQNMFSPMLDKMVELEKEYNEIVVLDINADTCEAAKKLRLKYVKVRTGTAEIHKDLKSFYLKGGRFVDGWKNAQLMASDGIEKKLKSIETHFEQIEKERIEKLLQERKIEVEKYVDNPEAYCAGIAVMEVEVWDNYLAGLKYTFEAKVKAEKEAEEAKIAAAKKAEEEKIEAERLAKIEADRVAEEQAKIKAENERLRKEAEEKERLRKIEDEKREAKLRAEREAREKKELEERLEREKIEKARIEKEAKEKAILQAKIDKERAEREAELAKQKAESERLRKIEDERIAKEKEEVRVKEEASKKAAMAPDKEKLKNLAIELSEYTLPLVNSVEAKNVIANVRELLNKVEAYVLTKIEKI